MPEQLIEPAAHVLLDGHVAISRIGFACAGIMRLPGSRERRHLIAAAIDAGLTHFDVARLYGLGAAEGELGRAIRGHESRVTVATKFGIDAPGTLRRLGRLQAPARALLAASPGARSIVRRRREMFATARVYDATRARLSLDTSLQELGLEHIDILFLHDPRPQDQIDTDGLMAFLEGARAAGKIRAWGMSFDDESGLKVLPRLPEPGIVQVRHHVLTDTKPRPRSIAFGPLSAHAEIAGWLSHEPAARCRWAEAIGADPLERDVLARLLVSHTLEQEGVAACLYATTKLPRLSVAACVLRSPAAPEQLDAFARCLADDRERILNGMER